MAKDERLNEEATLNNNLNSSTLKMNRDVTKQHKQPKVNKSARRNKN